MQLQSATHSTPRNDFYSQRIDKWELHWILELRESEFFEESFIKIIDEISSNGIGDKVDSILSWGVSDTEWSIEELGDKKFRISIWDSSVILQHAPEYSYVRITPDEDYRGIPLNFHTEQRNLMIYKAKELPSDEAMLLLKLRDMWIMKWSLPFLSLDSIETQLDIANEVEWFIRDSNNPTQPSELYDDASELLIENTHIVLQKESVIINEPIEWQALYTFWAWPCNIIAVQDKDTGKIWLAHIDATLSQSSIASFFSYFSNPDITLVSWDLWTTRTIIQAMWEDLRDNISYLNLDETRVDAMWIQVKNGAIRILYWDNQNMQVDDDRMRLLTLQIQLNKNLSIDIK